MKTRYYAEAQQALLQGDFTNPYLVDVYTGILYLGLLSSMPNVGRDGWQGAGELFNTGSAAEALYPSGVTPVANYQNGYAAVGISRSAFSDPELYFYADASLSSVVTEYRQEIEFPTATGNWGSVVGCALYAVRSTASGLRITPLVSVEFISPIVTSANRKIKIPNSAGSRIRVIELLQRQILE